MDQQAVANFKKVHEKIKHWATLSQFWKKEKQKKKKRFSSYVKLLNKAPNGCLWTYDIRQKELSLNASYVRKVIFE